MVDLSDEQDKKVKGYSLGMTQKLRLAQAPMEHPKILILDAPTNASGKKSVEKLHSILKDFLAKGETWLCSHNKGNIVPCYEEVCEFQDGRLEKSILKVTMTRGIKVMIEFSYWKTSGKFWYFFWY